MISAARFLGQVTACATLLIAGALVAPASAQSEACKADIVTATGKAKFRPFSKTKELEGRGSAMADAVASWQRDVSAKFGEQWKLWSKAKGTTFECAPTKTGKIIGSSFIGCTIRGRPCSFAAPPGGGVAVDGGGGTRDGGRRVRGRERLDAESRAYEREMAHQDHLAAERKRAEARAWERENARQRHLEDERRRIERQQSRRFD